MTLTERLLAPRVVLPVLALLILLLLITTPREPERQTPRLTTYSVHPMGGRAFARIAERLGWRIEQRLTPFRESLDTSATYVFLAPPVPVTSVETSRLLDAVRRGARILHVMGSSGAALTDSLRLRQSRRSYRPLPIVEQHDPTGEARHLTRGRDAFSEDLHHAIELRGPQSDDTVMFLSVRSARSGRFESPPVLPPGVTDDSILRPAMIGIPYGRGRIAVIADPNLLTNASLRDPEHGILPVRVLEWLAPPGTSLIFAEFHQGFGRQPSTVRAVGTLLLGTPAGRAVVTLAIAVAVLMLAAGVRPIEPLPSSRIERRSPLEHVDALASAYERIGGTKAATQRLVRGLKRRHLPPAARSRGDEEYLVALATRHRELEAPVRRVRNALHARVSAEELAQVGNALTTIERTIIK